jgi:predicted ATPase
LAVFTRVQTRGYRCLKSVDQALGGFRALVGPNASGKTTFLDIMALLGDLMRRRGDVVGAIQERSPTFQQMLWLGQGDAFQIAVEAEIPERVHRDLGEDLQRCTHVRYELEVGEVDGVIGLNHETLWLLSPQQPRPARQIHLFPSLQDAMPDLRVRTGAGRKVAVKKNPGGNDNYYNEGKRKTYNPSFKLGRAKSALANLPADSENFPVGSWFRDYLEQGVLPFVLNSQVIRRPSAPGQERRFRTDGANLPWIVAELRLQPARFAQWLAHVRTALEDIKDITTVIRPEDRHCYVVIEYTNGARVPSWLASDGTLRLLALTIPAYLPELTGTFLIEEPENGIHPRALETVLQSLSSIYGGQVLMATHSAVALNLIKPAEILCFAKDRQGATDIVSGKDHPALKEWKQGEPDLGLVFATGILS